MAGEARNRHALVKRVAGRRGFMSERRLLTASVFMAALIVLVGVKLLGSDTRGVESDLAGPASGPAQPQGSGAALASPLERGSLKKPLKKPLGEHSEDSGRSGPDADVIDEALNLEALEHEVATINKKYMRMCSSLARKQVREGRTYYSSPQSAGPDGGLAKPPDTNDAIRMYHTTATDRHLIEFTREEHPELFALRDLLDEHLGRIGLLRGDDDKDRGVMPPKR